MLEVFLKSSLIRHTKATKKRLICCSLAVAWVSSVPLLKTRTAAASVISDRFRNRGDSSDPAVGGDRGDLVPGAVRALPLLLHRVHDHQELRPTLVSLSLSLFGPRELQLWKAAGCHRCRKASPSRFVAKQREVNTATVNNARVTRCLVANEFEGCLAPSMGITGTGGKEGFRMC